MVKRFLHLSFLLVPLFGSSQDTRRLTLAEADSLARAHYPVSKQKELVKQTADLTIENLQKGFLPQVTVSGQATYQSDVTKVTIALPNVHLIPPDKDQYKLVADVSQLLYDGGLTREQKNLQQLNAGVEGQKVEVELYKLSERINQVYLGILYLDAQLKQVDIIREDLATGIKKVEAQVQNGVAFRSNLNMLKAESLKNDQRTIELSSSRKGMLDVLGLFIGQPLAATVQLEMPAEPATPETATILRPEMKLFDLQSGLIAQQSSLIRAKNLPRASLFAQGGYGKPGLNMLKNSADLFYIGGVRFNWSLGNLYTKKKEKELVEISKKSVVIQLETFVLNTQTQLTQQSAEISKLLQLITADNEIIGLRASVKEAAKAQLENGVISASDYVREVNAEDLARQSLITHQLQLLQAQINYQTISGKQ